ncbi:bifunctional DNA primase/polymerase [uncultured Mameliella sp.]|uniref:bifunctional DNA primase/polymerase n=1 Tax=uncultured Mameliella sp. TaxID=1447087 RepID=UPI002617FAF4|nr:bifunctional DNA primase/polymerase [uncultured Mameliella sp.]
MLANSPYAARAGNLREAGYSPMPVGPGTKVPGKYGAGEWRPLSGWQKYCDGPAPEFVHDTWERWPDAGICIAHGGVIGLDLDTDRRDVEQALHRAVEVPNVRRRGQKGWMGYYRPGDGLDGLSARVRWYDSGSDSKSPVVELLLHGTQSVLPPTIHPDTGTPYRWLTDESLEDVPVDDLPEFGGTDLDALDREFGKIGLTRQAPRRVCGDDYERPAASDHDLEKPFGRSVNDRALEALDQWWPALDMPKTRQRGAGAWEAVPFWRGSNNGRQVSERNPNLKASWRGIVDFGADRSYTPVDVVMAALDCDFKAATDWLSDFLRPEAGGDMGIPMSEPASAPENDTAPDPEPFDPSRWAATPVFAGQRRFHAVRPIAMPSDAAWEAMVPKEPPPFPVPDFGVCTGLLGDLARHIDDASATMTEAGALAVSLPILGAIFGRAYATPSNLRSNIYTVALGGSGTGKTSLVNPAKELMTMSGHGDVIGNDRFKSGSGLLQMLLQGPRRVSFLDEFGHMLQNIGNPGSGVHAKEILTEFTALYSAANTIFSGSAYADGRSTSIDYPHLCLFGMATPEQFWRAFGSSSLEDGSIARYLVFPLGETAPKEMDTSAAEGVAEALREAQAVMSSRVSGNLGKASLTTVPLDSYAEKARAALKEKESAFAMYAEKNGVRGGPAILRRVTENALKIALVSAVGRSPAVPEIDARDMEIGHALAWWSANVMISNIASHVADNQLERDVNDVERKIKSAGPDGIMKGRLKDRCRTIGKRAFEEIVESLCEAGIVDKMKVETRTRVAWKLVHTMEGGKDG